MRITSALFGIALVALPALAMAANPPPVTHTVANPYTDIGKYQQAFLALHTYRSSTQTQASGRAITTTTEYVEPDRYHSTAPGNEMISIGSDTWVHAGGKWSKIPKKIGGFTMPDVPGFSIGKAMDPATIMLLHGNPRYLCNAKDLGMQDGYHAILCQMSSNGMSANITLWLRADSLPAKIEITGSTGTTTTTYSDFNAPIVINQP
jgi:hypothetical protein